jgi:DNA polymerase I-like protein with 3'-5' exonuclease and polymerase domains
VSGPNGFLSRYAARKWCVVPVHRPNPDTGGCSCGKPGCAKPGKHPIGQFWPAGSTDPNHYVGRNTGVRVGPVSADLADVDADCAEAVAVGPLVLPATDALFGRGGQTTHRLYTVPDRGAAYLKLLDPVLEGDAATIVELRWPEWDEDEQRFKNLQTVFPPSLHFSGDTIEWVRDDTPATVAGVELVSAVRHVGAAVLLARYAKPKERHALVLLLANLLVRAGWEEDAKVVQFIAAVFTAKNDADKARKVADGEGLGAVKDARKRLKANKPMKGLPALKEMLDSTLDNATADKVVANIKNWLGIPDASGTKIPSGTALPDAGSDGSARPPAPPIPPYTPFPVHLLPSVPRAYVEATAAAMNCDLSYSALPALAALGAAIGGSHAAAPKKRWKEPPYIWGLAVGKSGAIKSPPYRDVEDMAEDINDRLETEHEAAMELYESEREQWEDARDGGADPGPRPKEPTKRAFIKGDVTIEALVGKLQENPRGLLIGQDELSAWIGSFVKYAGKTGTSDLPRWLQLHHAGTINYTRKTGDPERREVRVRGVGVSVTGTIQPKVLSRVLTEEFRSSGFLARLLLAMPPWRKRQWTEAEIDEPVRTAFAELLNELYQLPAGTWPNGKPAPHLVKLSEEAKVQFVAFYNANGEALETADEDMSAVMSKLEGYALRFALIFHCCRLKEYAKGTPITAGDMTAAIELTKWFRDEAERVYLALAESPEVQSARHLAEVIRKLAQKCNGRVTPRNLQRFNCRKYPTAEAAEAALERLVGLGFGRWESAPASGKGGAPTRGYVPCMTHDTTAAPRADDPPDEGDGDDGLHDTTPDDRDPPRGGPHPTSDETTSESGSYEHGGEGGPGNVSRASCVMHDGERPVADPNEPFAAGAGLCHATEVVSCTGSELVSVPDRLEEVIQALRTAPTRVGLDLETTGLNPARNRVRLLSLATATETFVIDLFALADPVQMLAPLWAVLAEKELVGHNIVSFDLPFLARLGFAPTRVFDTALASRVVYAGGRVDHDLAAVVQRELGRVLDKGEQASDWSRPELTLEQIAYAAADVEVLLPLADALRTKAAERKVDAVVDLEMRCGVPVAHMAANGVGFDADSWRKLADAAAERRVALAAEMDALVPNPNCLPGLAAWNWDSNTGDVIKAFAAVGITLADTKEETLAGIDQPLARSLLAYREAAKRANTYGRQWVDEHVTGGRVYATWNPCQAKTGRMSCKAPNLQQIPRDVAYRRCFVAKPGHVLIKCDFSQIELRIAAKVTGDQRMLAAYQAGEDLHTLTAARFLGVGAEAVTKEARQMAKPVNFGAIYGLGPRSLRLKARADYGKEMTEAQARGFLDAFFAQYPGVRVWHNRIRREKATAVRTLGSRRIAVEADQFYGAKANYVVQGTGGDGLKRALVLLWERRAQCPRAEVVLAVHDEVVIEVPEQQAAAAKVWVERGMIDAMAPLIEPVPIEVEAKVGRTWAG